MKRSTMLILVLLVSPLLLFSNGEGETKENVVTLWHSNSGIIGETFDKIIDDFNNTVGKENNIYIDSIYQGASNDVLTKVKASELSNTLPDIAQLDATALTDMNNADYLVPIDEIGINTDSIVENNKIAFSSEKGLLGLPFNGSALLLYYNKDVFEESGVEPPKTIDEFSDIAEKIAKRDDSGNIVRYAFAGVPTTFELTSFIGSQNGLSYIVNNKNGHEGVATEVLIGKEGTYKEFLEKWKRLYDTGYVNNITSGVLTEFASGRTATMLSSSSDLSTIIESVGDSFHVGVSEIPMVNENATGGVAPSGGAMFAFTKSDEVKIVLEYLIREDVQLKWAMGTGYIPLNTDTYEMDEYKEFIENNPDFDIARRALSNSNPLVTNVWLPSAYQIYYSFQKNIDDVTKGAITIDQGVDQMVKTIEDALKTYAEQNLV